MKKELLPPLLLIIITIIIKINSINSKHCELEMIIFEKAQFNCTKFDLEKKEVFFFTVERKLIFSKIHFPLRHKIDLVHLKEEKELFTGTKKSFFHLKSSLTLSLWSGTVWFGHNVPVPFVCPYWSVDSRGLDVMLPPDTHERKQEDGNLNKQNPSKMAVAVSARI